MSELMKYFYIEPEVAGGIGSNVATDCSVHPPRVSNLDYEFEIWPHDVLIEGFPCWIVTIPAMERIRAAKLTGVSFKDVEISFSEQFRDLHRNRRLPAFVWLDVSGRPGHDDFGTNKSFTITGTEKLVDARRFTLVISERAIEVLKALGISHASIHDFTEERSASVDTNE
jgi:hypothetical protein